MKWLVRFGLSCSRRVSKLRVAGATVSENVNERTPASMSRSAESRVGSVVSGMTRDALSASLSGINTMLLLLISTIVSSVSTINVSSGDVAN